MKQNQQRFHRIWMNAEWLRLIILKALQACQIMKPFFINCCFVVCVQLQGVAAYSQTDSLRLNLVRSLSTYIKDHYVSAELARQMSDSINWKLNNGMYDTA